jgi:hypothetical protein
VPVATEGRFDSLPFGEEARVSDDVVALVKARSLLIILMATCRETLLALDATGNLLDVDLASDLRRMIVRSETELTELTAKLPALGS